MNLNWRYIPYVSKCKAHVRAKIQGISPQHMVKLCQNWNGEFPTATSLNTILTRQHVFRVIAHSTVLCWHLNHPVAVFSQIGLELTGLRNLRAKDRLHAIAMLFLWIPRGGVGITSHLNTRNMIIWTNMVCKMRLDNIRYSTSTATSWNWVIAVIIDLSR